MAAPREEQLADEYAALAQLGERLDAARRDAEAAAAPGVESQGTAGTRAALAGYRHRSRWLCPHPGCSLRFGATECFHSELAARGRGEPSAGEAALQMLQGIVWRVVYDFVPSLRPPAPGGPDPGVVVAAHAAFDALPEDVQARWTWADAELSRSLYGPQPVWTRTPFECLSRAAVEALLRKRCGECADIAALLLRPVVYMVRPVAAAVPGLPRAESVASTRMGGWPDLPTSAPWPRHRTTGAALPFVMQIRFEEVAAAATAAGATLEVPRNGLLLVFSDFTPVGTVLMFVASPQDTPIARREVSPMPSDYFHVFPLQVACSWSLPTEKFDPSVDWTAVASQVAAAAPETAATTATWTQRISTWLQERMQLRYHHYTVACLRNGGAALHSHMTDEHDAVVQLSGYTFYEDIHGTDFTKKPEDAAGGRGIDASWVPLLQLDSLALSGGGDVPHYWTVWIRREDLAAARFDRVRTYHVD